jgi:DNA replication protein DnaC
MYERVSHPNVELLVIDDMGSEISTNGDKRIDELTKQYNDLVRTFYKKGNKGLLLVTSNFDTDDLKKAYKNDERLFSMIFQQGSTRYFTITADAQFRQKKVAKSLELLD